MFYKMENNENWDNEIAELETFFNGIELPTYDITLDKSTKIKDVNKFIKSHLVYVKANNGNKIFRPYLDRLYGIKNKICTAR